MTMPRHVGGMIDRLEVQNFKSYKKRQVLGPFKQFTAVIGPNGSGKSNLMDAISFVLGVQSKQLRGNTLSDLMYSAEELAEGERRRAFVKLVFKPDPVNQPEEEVHFSRTLAQSGQTAYQLNDKHCTWDQYNDKLFSYNVITKAKNFLVFQGDVESIASKSPKDLTELFEKIAGSDELKDAYDTLEREKDEAEDLVTRCFAKRKALTTEKKMTKMQKEEADKHLKLQGELQAARTQLNLFQLFHIEKDADSAREAIETHKAAVATALRECSELDKSTVDLKRQLQEATKATLVAERKLDKQKALLEEQTPRLVKNKEELGRAMKKLKGAQTAVEVKRRAHEARTTEIAKLEQDIEDARLAERAFFKEAEQAARTSGSIQMGEQQLSAYHRLNEEAGAKTYKLKQEREVLETEQQRERSEKSNLEASVKEQEARLERLEAQMEATKSKVESAEANKARDSQSLVSLKQQYAQLNDKARKARIKEDAVQTKLDAVEGKLREAKAGQKEGERERKQQETVEALKHHFQGVRGRLVDLIKVTQRKHNLAVTVCMGRNMDAVVVDDEKTAKECVQYLKEQRLSLMTFIPLATIRVKPVDERLRNMGGTAKLAMDVIEYDEAVERAVVYALGPALVCDTHKEAKKLCYGREQHKVVSLDGTLLSKGGVMTGGTSGSMEAKAARFERQALEGMRAERQQLMDEMNELGSARERQLELEQAKSAASSLERAIREAEDDAKLNQAKLKKLQMERENLQQSREKALPDVAICQTNLQERDVRIRSLTAKINEVQDKIYAAFSKSVGVSSIREYEETQLRQAQEQAERKMQFSTHAAKLRAALEYETRRDTLKPISDAEATIEKHKAMLVELQQEEATISGALHEHGAAMAVLQEEVAVKKDTSDALEVKLKESKDISSAKLGQVAKAKRNLANKESALEQTIERRLAVLRTCEMSEVAAGDAAAALDETQNEEDEEEEEEEEEDADDMETDDQEPKPKKHKKNRRRQQGGLEDLSLDYSKLPRHLQVSMTEAQRAKQEQDLKSRMEAMTTELEKLAPNLKAVEQYENLKERERTFLEELEAAKEVAKVAAEKFHATKQARTESFMQAFNHIQAHIDPIYKELTMKPGHVLGGTAYLTLENQDEPFLHGIKFTAMPPTKRFRDMEQLSGGEKTVAALGLLFTIHSYRPSPFFVLDEVDAALDNTNVEKVAKYIMQKSHLDQAKGGFQSVVISLKDMFYDKADALIGVCKDPEDNSSITFSFDLERFKN